MMSKRLAVTIVAAILLAMLMVTPIFAANVHLKGGKKATPIYTDNGLTLSAPGCPNPNWS